MGAYTKGEIKSICEIVPPDISVITGINEQHLSLFRNIENTLQAKYEIIQYAKGDAVVVVNGDSNLVAPLIGKSRKKEILYSTKKELDLWASDIKSMKDRIVFNVYYQGKKQRFEVNILGEHNVSNILAACACALLIGMSLEKIASILKKHTKKVQIGRLVVKKSKFKYQVVDDNYNSNPEGFEAALDFLSTLKAKRRILVTIGIIELGAASHKVYEKISKRIVEICDVLITTDEKLRDMVLKNDGSFNVIFDKGISKQLEYLRQKVGKDDVVLFEGPNMRLIKEII